MAVQLLDCAESQAQSVYINFRSLHFRPQKARVGPACASPTLNHYAQSTIIINYFRTFGHPHVINIDRPVEQK